MIPTWSGEKDIFYLLENKTALSIEQKCLFNNVKEVYFGFLFTS